MSSRDLYSAPPERVSKAQTGMSRRALLRLRPSAVSQREIDWDGLTERLRRGWDAGDHSAWLRAIEPVASVVVEAAGVGSASRVLDVGAGDGSVALAAVACGADVDACDLAPSMVARGRERTGEAVTWRVADAARLPYPDASFDAVLSAFGAAQAPFARQVAAELARVARPGGVVCVAAWVPRGLPGRLDEVVEPWLPLPDGVRLPSAWGRQEVAQERLSSVLDDVRVLTRTVRLAFPSPDALYAALLSPLPLPDGAAAELRPQLDRLLASCNNMAGSVDVDARYLVTVGRRA